MKSHRIAAALVLVALSAVADAAGPRLKLPSFDHLQSQAVDSVDITLGWLPLHLARLFIHDDDPDGAEAREMLKSVESVSVRNYRFGSDFVYPMKDLDDVRSQLAGNGWSQLVQVRDRRKQENVDVFLSLDGDKITGIVVIASEPREFTIVNVVGKLGMDQVERWASQARSGGSHRWGGRRAYADARGWESGTDQADEKLEKEPGSDAAPEDGTSADASSPGL